ncbi:MAG TPA: hypothetical protein VF982_11415, partial [Anaerolineales bacterium]
CMEWSVGFFLNNARYRLYRIREKMPEIQATSEFVKPKSCTEPAFLAWCRVHKILCTRVRQILFVGAES